jgi:hypothetical protein
MREFSTLACDFALSVTVHGRESALACRHLTSVDAKSECIANATNDAFRNLTNATVKSPASSERQGPDRPTSTTGRSGFHL